MAIKLLIVDDAPFIRELFQQLAISQGFELVGEAEDGQQGVDMALKLRPDLILMDIVMPEMSGIEATKRILQEWPEARIVACSTLDQAVMVEKALEAGCCHYMTKPFETEGFSQTVKEFALGGE